jgi:hypothetical protein
VQPASDALFQIDVLLALSKIESVLWLLMATMAVLWGLTMFGLVVLAKQRKQGQ